MDGSAHKSRAQSAMEYLTTYGWAFIILAIAMVGLFYFNIFTPASAVGTSTCVINQGLGCTNPYINVNGLLSFTLTQSRTDPINITAIGCASYNATNPHTSPPYNPPSNQVYLAPGTSYNFTVQCYSPSGIFKGALGGAFQGHIYVNFVDDATGFTYSSTGTTFSKVSFISSTSSTSTTSTSTSTVASTSSTSTSSTSSTSTTSTISSTWSGSSGANLYVCETWTQSGSTWTGSSCTNTAWTCSTWTQSGSSGSYVFTGSGCGNSAYVYETWTQSGSTWTGSSGTESAYGCSTWTQSGSTWTGSSCTESTYACSGWTQTGSVLSASGCSTSYYIYESWSQSGGGTVYPFVVRGVLN